MFGRFTTRLSFCVFCVSQILNAGSVPVTFNASGYQGSLWLDGKRFPLQNRIKDTSLQLLPGSHRLGISARPAGNIQFEIAEDGTITTTAMGLTVGPERGKLQLRLHQVFVSFLKDSGAVYCIPELNLNSNSAMEIQVIAGEEYRLHTGNQWDTTVSVTDSLFVSFSTGFSFHTDNQGQLYTKGSPNTVLTDKNRLILQTSNLWICPCHFGNRCAGVVVGETGDTIKMWKRMTVISGLAMKIRMLDSENTVLQENYFLPEKNGTLKRKHLIRIY